MRALKPDLRAQPGTARPTWALLAAGLAVAGAWLIADAWRLDRQAQHHARELQLVASSASRPTHALALTAPAYADDALTIARTASIDWTGIFTTVQAVQVTGVRVTMLAVAAAEASVQLSVEADRLESAMDYLRLLNAGEPDTKWQLKRLGARGTSTQPAAGLPPGGASPPVVAHFARPLHDARTGAGPAPLETPPAAPANARRVAR